MVLNTLERDKPHPIRNSKDDTIVAFVAGTSMLVLGLADFLGSTTRIKNEVRKQIPPVFNSHLVEESRQSIDSFNKDLNTSIRRGDLVIEIPAEVTQRLRIAHSIVDHDIERQKQELALFQELSNEEFAFNLDPDPNKFYIGRAIGSYISGITGLFLAAGGVGFSGRSRVK